MTNDQNKKPKVPPIPFPPLVNGIPKPPVDPTRFKQAPKPGEMPFPFR